MTDNNSDFFAAPEQFANRKADEQYKAEPYRTDFSRDRDRILYSKAFRRLSGKTQVFLPSTDDHFRTRLTHTVEVSQLAKTVGKNLGLNLDLIEAIALGHDLGHAPFGHVGERTLNFIMNNCDNIADFQKQMEEKDWGFKHNFQSVRITNKLAKLYGLEGLNLLNFTNWGILNHSKTTWKKCNNLLPVESEKHHQCFLKRNQEDCDKKGNLSIGFYLQDNNIREMIEENKGWSFEGYLVGICDEIAQRHHDIEDGLLSNILSSKDLKEFISKLIENYRQMNYQSKNTAVYDLYNKNSTIFSGEKKDEIDLLIPLYSRFITSLYCTVLIENALNNFNRFKTEKGYSHKQDFIESYSSLEKNEIEHIIRFPDQFKRIDEDLQNFLKDRILNSQMAQQMDGKGRFIIRNIIKAYISNPRQMQDQTIDCTYKIYREMMGDEQPQSTRIGKLRDDIDSPKNRADPQFQIALLRAVCDNIAGMTDNYAKMTYERLYG